MKKLLFIFSIFLSINSCGVYNLLGNFFDDCNEISYSPSKTYNNLIRANTVIEHNNNQYTYLISYGGRNYSSRSRVSSLCCECKKLNFILVKNFTKNYAIDLVVDSIDEYTPNKLFIVYEKKKFIYEFSINKNNLNYHTFSFDKYGNIDKNLTINDISAFLTFKNEKNEEIIIKGSLDQKNKEIFLKSSIDNLII